MKKSKVFTLALALLIFLVLNLQSVLAEDVVFTLNQSDYYFILGEQAVVPLQTENKLISRIDGTLTYTIAQSINQGNVQYSSSNTQSSSFPLEKGKNTVSLNFGPSDSEATLKADINFIYNLNGEKTVKLPTINIHFVKDPNQKQNTQNQQKSSSQQQAQNQQNSLSQQMQNQMQQMQKQMNQMFNQQQPAQTNSQQSLQNNQIAQDSSAVKQQLQKQMEQQQQMQQEFQKNLAQNQEFQQQHQDLIQQGYNLTGGNLNPSTNNTGDFELNYQKGSETATLKGSLNNGTMKKIDKQTSEDTKNLMNLLNSNNKFNDYDSKLKKEGFVQNPPEISKQDNLTTVKLNYLNEKNETAQIIAKIDETKKEVKEVKLIKENSSLVWIILFIVIVLALLSYWLYQKYFKKITQEEIKKQEEVPIDYRKESLRLLEESKKLFDNGQEKDAYGMAANAIRFFYSYHLGLKKEITNSELIKTLKKNKLKYQNTQECLNLSSLVEFAKYQANKIDFEQIISLGEKIIKEN